MLPTWLFEADVFGETADALKAEVRRQGMACYVTRQDLLTKGAGDTFHGRRIGEDDCVIASGCFPFVNYIKTHRSWIPGVWCTPEILACSTYYPHFAPYVLNDPHWITTGVEATGAADRIFEELSHDGKVFVRPDGCQKIFTGRVVDRDEFPTALARARYDPETKVVIAPPRRIGREWRLVIAEDKVIAGSQYFAEGELELAPHCPDEVLGFASRMLRETHWRPDPIFMLDVCESEGKLHLLEINGFSCSALYPCDHAAVVTAAAQLAERAWRNRDRGTLE
jgi:hypothetical protein